jgi:hypothetical protein
VAENSNWVPEALYCLVEKTNWEAESVNWVPEIFNCVPEIICWIVKKGC